MNNPRFTQKRKLWNDVPKNFIRPEDLPPAPELLDDYDDDEPSDNKEDLFMNKESSNKCNVSHYFRCLCHCCDCIQLYMYMYAYIYQLIFFVLQNCPDEFVKSVDFSSCAVDGHCLGNSTICCQDESKFLKYFIINFLKQWVLDYRDDLGQKGFPNNLKPNNRGSILYFSA